MTTAALIPARAGSKGIVGKNTRPFNGAPLLSWAVMVGLKTCEQTWVSTDDEKTRRILPRGVGFIKRPKALATDTASMLPVIQHALLAMAQKGFEPEVVVLLQPTQPLRTVKHVKMGLRLLETSGADSVVSVVEVPAHYSPDFAMKVENGALVPYLDRDMPTRRQDCRKAYSRDGTVYALKADVVLSGDLYGNAVPLVIPADESCNLDSEDDWSRAEMMVSHAQEAV